jgi:transcriptional regulator EpsA
MPIAEQSASHRATAVPWPVSRDQNATRLEMTELTLQENIAWNEQKAGSLLSLLQGALAPRNQLGWSRWLQGDIQLFLPHDVLIAAWGDFRSGALAYDVITRSPTLGPCAWATHEIEPMMLKLFARWVAAQQEPVVMEAARLYSDADHSFPFCRSALVHGVQDHRSHYDCIYLFLGPEELASPFSQQVCRMVLPFIDLGFRQLPDRGQKRAQHELSGTGFGNSSFAECLATGPGSSGTGETHFGDSGWAEPAAGERGSPLSARELEIMQWVRMGKTNAEIAIILSLSTFTVKNHMRRIYRKLDVLNRAQAVGSLEGMQAVPRSAAR